MSVGAAVELGDRYNSCGDEVKTAGFAGIVSISEIRYLGFCE